MLSRAARYWLWRFNLWRTAHLLPEWHRAYKAQIAKRRKSHKARKAIQQEYTRRVHAALRQEVNR
jgi:hypothetical protein